MHLYSFRFYRLPLTRFFTVFPLRPLTLLSLRKNPATSLTYWYRPHTSKEKLPVLFVHGIGIGLYTYVNFLAQLNRPDVTSSSTNSVDSPAQEDTVGHIGIIAIELMPISFRVTGEMPSSKQLLDELHQILKHHGWNKFVLVSHSYGSVVSTHLLQSKDMGSMIQSLVLIDPVSILLHLPEVAYNFTARKPRRANEHQLYYFASMDMGVAHTLYRHFFWDQCVLWKEDVAGKDVTVVLAGRDLIVDTAAVAKYLLEDDDSESTGKDFRNCKWKGKGLDLVWFDELDHAQVFDSKQDYSVLARVVRDYSSRGGIDQINDDDNL